MRRVRKRRSHSSQEDLCADSAPASPAAWMGGEPGPTAQTARSSLHLSPHGNIFQATLRILNCNPTLNATPTYSKTIVSRSITSIYTLDK